MARSRFASWFALRYSLRALLVGMLLAAIGLGIAKRLELNGRRQKEIVACLKGMGGKVVYDFQIERGTLLSRVKQSIATHFGPDSVGEVRELDLTVVNNESALYDYGLQDVAKLRSLEVLSLGGSQYIHSPDDFLEALSGMPNLRRLSLRYGPELPNLAPLERLPQLESLSLNGSSGVTGERLVPLRRFRRLKTLDLGQTNIRNEGLARLVVCTRLEELNLVQARRLTPTGLSVLSYSPSLRKVTMNDYRSYDVPADFIQGIEIYVPPEYREVLGN